MFAIILLDSGIWKALSFALMIIAAMFIGYNSIFKAKEEDKEIEMEQSSKVSQRKE